MGEVNVFYEANYSYCNRQVTAYRIKLISNLKNPRSYLSNLFLKCSKKQFCTISQICFQSDFVADSPKPADLPKTTKQDIPNRFWAMVEPYCTEISNDDLKVQAISLALGMHKDSFILSSFFFTIASFYKLVRS